MGNRNAILKFLLFCNLLSILFITSQVECQESLLNLEQLQKTPDITDLASRQDGPGGDSIGGFIGGALPNPPPQNVPVGGGLGGDLGLDFVPFGLNHIILIILPQFKTKYQKLPAWLSSSIKISMPITVFFDQLIVPPGMPIPMGAGGIFLPFGIPPTLGGPGLPPPLPPSPPPPVPNITPGVPLNAGGSPALPNAHTAAGYAAYYPQSPAPYITPVEYEEDGDADDETENEGEGDDSYYPEEGRKMRSKRHVPMNQTQTFSTYSPYFINPEPHRQYMFNMRKKRAAESSFNESTVHKAERASLLPKIEEVLSGAGMEGKSCLLRTICEVHEAPLNHYGLMGELLTMFLSVSKSVFAERLLPEYLEAEAYGKSGKCTEYYKNCENTLFSWEEIEETKQNTKKKRKLLSSSSTKTINEVLQ